MFHFLERLSVMYNLCFFNFSDKQAKGKNSKPGKSKGKNKQPVAPVETRDGRNNLIGSKCCKL